MSMQTIKLDPVFKCHAKHRKRYPCNEYGLTLALIHGRFLALVGVPFLAEVNGSLMSGKKWLSNNSDKL